MTNKHFTSASQPPESLPSYFPKPREHTPPSSSCRNNWNYVYIKIHFTQQHTQRERSAKECKEKRKFADIKKKKTWKSEGKENDRVVAQYHQHTLSVGVQKSDSLPCIVLPRPCPNFQPCFWSSRCPMLS